MVYKLLILYISYVVFIMNVAIERENIGQAYWIIIFTEPES